QIRHFTRLSAVQENRPWIGLKIKQPAGLSNRFRQIDTPRVEIELALRSRRPERNKLLLFPIHINPVTSEHKDVVLGHKYKIRKRHCRAPPFALQHDPGLKSRSADATRTRYGVGDPIARPDTRSRYTNCAVNCTKNANQG